MKRKAMASVALVGLVGAIGIGTQLGKAQNSPESGMALTTSKVMVGGDIHTLTLENNSVIISGHESAAISLDEGRNWSPIKALDGADVMGWSSNSAVTFAGGHAGLFVSPLNKNEFTRVNFFKDLSDVHAIGSSGSFAYLATPQLGLLASADAGKSWAVRSTQVGQGFMGAILVDPKNPLRILAPDMQLGLLTSFDGGRTWKSLGGPMGAMSVAWNPTNISEIVAIGMGGAEITKDGGATWSDLTLPNAAAAIAFSENGENLFAASLDEAPYAHLFKSIDGARSWSMSVTKSEATNLNGSVGKADVTMDPNMPGMDHSESASAMVLTPKRPLKAVLGIFGLASTLVLASAYYLRKKSEAAKARKLSERSKSRIAK